MTNITLPTTGETIFALASGKGRAGVAVIRISGPMAGEGVRALTGRKLPPPRHASLQELSDPNSGELLDRGLVLWFPAPDSFTGEDVAELHIHGGSAVVAAVYRTLGGMRGVRIAAAGEFSLRAFHHGRLDLTEVEGLNDLVWAETDAQRSQALRQLGGKLGTQYESWRERLIGALAYFEAAIDFSDEELPDDVIATALQGVQDVLGEVDRHLEDGHRGERIRAGFEIVILGVPNVGKSSLLNALAKSDVAIVSDVAGTTRDVVQVRLDLGGYMVELSDTAGLREAGDGIEAEGVRRALARAEDAAMTLLVISAEESALGDGGGCDVPAELQAHLGPDTLVVVNKCDLAPDAEVAERHFAVSALSGEGIDALLSALSHQVVSRLDGLGDVSLTRVRHRDALMGCREALAAVLSDIGRGQERSLELVAENLRVSVGALGRITGRVDVESVLDVVFSDFCIGK